MRILRIRERGGRMRLASLAILAMTAPAIYGQITSGTVLGTVLDPSGRSITGASVDLIDQKTQTQRNIKTDASGNFVFASVAPSTYTVRVESTGFQKLEQKENELSAGERLALNLQLTVGAVSETVSVVAQGGQVQIASSESSSLLTGQQLDTIAQKGRVITNYLFLVPGFATNGGTTDGSSAFIGAPSANGLPNTMTTIAIDGFQGGDPTLPSLFTTTINPDAIEEMNVLANNYQAEHGRNGGATVNVVTKSGTRDFHGTAYYYKRHEMFNANDFFNNRSGRAKNIYRYNTEGVSIGGPVILGKLGKFNSNRDKLFFFYNFDNSPSQARDRRIATLPTALERTGDFSQSFNTAGTLIALRDPLTGGTFPGNIIPASRINKQGQNLLSAFGQPNQLNRGVTLGAYNNEFQNISTTKRVQHVWRLDYHPTNTDTLFYRGSTYVSDGVGNQANFDLAYTGFKAPSKQAVAGWTRVLSGTMVNEFSSGLRRPHEDNYLSDNGALRSKYNFTAGQISPSNNPIGILPIVSFTGAGLQNTPGFTANWNSGRLGEQEADVVYYFQDNFTRTQGRHTLKFGAYYESARSTGAAGFLGNPFGSFNFSVDANNPNDARHPFANAVLGNFLTYSESTRRTRPAGVTADVEWFAQDSWKVNKRLTLEIGMRFVTFTPSYAWNGLGTAFVQERYNPAKAPTLYLPTLVNGQSFALNPLTGTTTFPALIGAYVPGTGDPANGAAVSSDQTNPHGFVNNDGVKFQPRFGFAYDAFGDGKTAIRGGFGIQHQLVRNQPGSAGAPISFDPIYYYGNLNTFLTAGGNLSPGSTTGNQLDRPTPAVYNMSLGVQRSFGKTTAEIKYVGTMARHLASTRDIDLLPYGTRFLASSINPRTNALYPDSFLRPLPGYNSIVLREAGNSSTYHSLQASLNRRYANGFQYGVSYTYSKAMDYGSAQNNLDGARLATFQNYRTWNYEKASFDQTHVFTVNYTYDLPGVSKLVTANGLHGILKAAFDNWELSGITSFSTGTPASIGLSLSDGADLVGGGDGVRAILTGDPRISHSERGFLQMFNTSVFARPAKGNFGNAGLGIVRNPGITNFDATLFKRFPWKEKRAFELRWEAYNVFNHTQFSAMNTTATFNAAGTQVNTAFGQATAARAPRIMQVAVRFRF